MALPQSMTRWFKRSTWRFAAQGVDYGLVLPLMARLPLRWAYRLSDWRGALNAACARDWAELSVGFPYVGERSAAAFREVRPHACDAEIRQLVLQRYQTVAREELDGLLAIRGRLSEIKMDLAPIRTALAQRAAGRGLVVVMSHFDNLFLGLVGMVRCGEPVYLMTSDIMQDGRVHMTVRKFFRVKYQRYQEQMGASEFLHTSASARDRFYDVLKQGGIVVVVSETPAAPGNNDKGTWVSWLGRRRKMADSAVRMAVDTNSQVIGMRNMHTLPGHVAWQWSPLVDPQDFITHSPETVREMVYAPIFAFLEAGIKADPGRWWAAHLLGDFAIQNDTPNVPMASPATSGPSSAQHKTR